MAWRIGIDIGGTFTDVALIDDASGHVGVAKVPTTPHDLAEGVLGALDTAMRRYQVAAAEVELLSHATTVVTNAILEETGARAALITTRGFRDVLELRRSARADLYDLFQDAPATLIPRRRRFEITERIGADGAVVTPLAENEIDGLVAALKAARVDAVAISLLFSFLNPEHEQRLGARLRAALPDVPVYLSSEVLPEIKEFERTSTTAVCAYTGPILTSYLQRLDHVTRSRALPPLYVMGSNGGILEAAEALSMPAMAVESGPAAGVVAAALVARQTGRLDLLSFDMGGTTAKASLIRGGHYETTPDYEVGGGSSMSRWMNGTGHPIRVPVIDLAEVSAGGGSIAWVDRAGGLRVGPKSAGADPGPVCYARGGMEPTVTDCNLLLGYLDKASLLVGTDLKRDYVRTLYTTAAAAEPKAVEAAFVALESRGAAMLDRAGVAPARRRFERAVDARYPRQSHELMIPVPPRSVDAAALAEIAAAFHDRHLRTYGHDNRSEPVQIVSIRVTAIGATAPLLIRDAVAPSGTDAVKGKRQLWFRETGVMDATIYDRRRMATGLEVAGPVVIESLESTILVPPGWQAKMNADGFVLMTRLRQGAGRK